MSPAILKPARSRGVNVAAAVSRRLGRSGHLSVAEALELSQQSLGKPELKRPRGPRHTHASLTNPHLRVNILQPRIFASTLPEWRNWQTR